MADRRPYRVPTPETVQRRKEWVSLDGGDVCVWEMTVVESLMVAEHAARPPGHPLGGADPKELGIWKVIASVYDTDQPGAQQVFVANPKAIGSLRLEEFARLSQAIGRVNGDFPEEEEALRDFTPAPGAPKPSE
mgnify:CR=1 FL=1